MYCKLCFRTMGAILLLTLFTSCLSVSSSTASTSLDGLKATATAELASMVGLTGLTQKARFKVLYTQVMYVGGYGGGTFALEEGQGLVWKTVTTDEDGNTTSVTAERALLKNLPDGDEWWYLGWDNGTDKWEYEVLMDANQKSKKIRFYNSDLQRVEEAEFNSKLSLGSGSDDAAPASGAIAGINWKDLTSYIQGTEKITVGAGTYQAQKLDYTVKTSSSETSYTWWTNSDVPGELIKYAWIKTGTKSVNSGELAAIKKGYTTKFSSY
ncbi:hypothetical protein K7I13_06680 [Brucepastera parasyntrophica]|uniref:hypothetical protein n=1 Tax=Brucepastera parasyntrophica TaxID=2880008 RepID=UPI00210A30C2|nr:hypothetical protein [Brucepastera parasyntrophica]ULQ60935.1 hypothetical protein K7I13_06680 [Brucepastera parasyntrophica]